LIDEGVEKPRVLDSEIVAGIMQEFVEHLGEHWSAEAARQRHRADRRAAIWSGARAYLLNWERFSDSYMAQLDAASTSNPGPFLLIAILPPLFVLLFHLAPFAEPPASALGEHLFVEQGLFWLYGDPLVAAVCMYIFPRFWVGTVRLKPDRSVEAKFVLWTVGVTVVIVGTSFTLATALGAFPVPMGALVQANVGACFIPLLWWCVPKEQRADPMLRSRTRYGMLGQLAIMVIFAIGLPVLNVMLAHSSGWWQDALIVSCFLVAKLSFERIGHGLAPKLGADCMPCFIFVAKLCYEVNLCIALSTGFNWFVFIELVAFDAVENLYHLWSLLHTDVDKVDNSEDAQARQYYIVATMVLREFAEVCTMAHFILEFSALRLAQPKLNSLVCASSEDEFKRMEGFLLLSFGVEIAIICANCCVLRRKGFQPLLVLRGLLATNLGVFLAAACASHMYYFVFQHTHFGMDSSFKFRWLHDAGAEWQCGLSWS
jgi:hypothetical protein